MDERTVAFKAKEVYQHGDISYHVDMIYNEEKDGVFDKISRMLKDEIKAING